MKARNFPLVSVGLGHLRSMTFQYLFAPVLASCPSRGVWFEKAELSPARRFPNILQTTVLQTTVLPTPA